MYVLQECIDGFLFRKKKTAEGYYIRLASDYLFNFKFKSYSANIIFTRIFKKQNYILNSTP